MFFITVVDDGTGERYKAIRSDLNKNDFLIRVLISIGGYNKSEAEYVIEEVDPCDLTDYSLKENGIKLPISGYSRDYFFLRLVEEGLWEFQENLI